VLQQREQQNTGKVRKRYVRAMKRRPPGLEGGIRRDEFQKEGRAQTQPLRL
jgi:hypothetical protein